MYGTVLNVRNVNEALPLGLQLVKEQGVPVTSRGMDTLEVPGPVLTVYANPVENVLTCPTRDANPFFHFFESMWILAGSNTVALPRFFLEGIVRYSDNGETFHGAYGHRLRHWPIQGSSSVVDQLENVIICLTLKPDTRQAVMSIWNPDRDLGAGAKDIPCNDMVMFKIRDGFLNMTVCNRSNDVIWGAYGANAVQFSFLQAYVAARVGVAVGTYTQVSDSFHVYTDLPLWKAYVAGEYRPDGHVVNPYEHPMNCDHKLFTTHADALFFEHECKIVNGFAEGGLLPELVNPAEWTSVLGRGTARPMLAAFLAYKKREFIEALSYAHRIERDDWRLACTQWLSRRAVKAGAL